MIFKISQLFSKKQNCNLFKQLEVSSFVLIINLEKYHYFCFKKTYLSILAQKEIIYFKLGLALSLAYFRTCLYFLLLKCLNYFLAIRLSNLLLIVLKNYQKSCFYFFEEVNLFILFLLYFKSLKLTFLRYF